MMAWLLESALYWAVFFGLYRWLLQRETFHFANRLYLLITLFAGLLLPLLPSDCMQFGAKSTDLAGYFVLLPTLTISEIKPANHFTFDWSQLLLGIYFLASLVVLLKLTATLWRLMQLQRQACVTSVGAFRVVENDEIEAPFSFWRTVFLPTANTWSVKERDVILTHEVAHVSQWHSLDLLFVEFLKVVFWWAPPLMWYKTALCDVHEFLADKAALQESDRKWYGSLLLRHAHMYKNHSLVHSFIRSQLQKRIIMMTRPSSSPLARWKYAVALPSALCLMFVLPQVSKAQEAPAAPPSPPEAVNDAPPPPPPAFGFNAPPPPPPPPPPAASRKAMKSNKSAKAPMAPPPPPPPPPPPAQAPKHNGGVQSATSLVDTLDPVLSVVEIQPEYSGGMDALFKFLGSNIKYPKAAQKAKAEGTVYISFVVEKDGSLSTFEVKRGIKAKKGDLLEKEALRVVKSMPKWNPGKDASNKTVRVSYILPIKFKLS